MKDDMISRQAAISEIMEDLKDRSLHDDPATPEDYAEGYDEGIRNAAAIVLQVPSAQSGGEDARSMCGECDAWNQYKSRKPCEDAVSRFEVLRLIDYSSHDLNDSVDNRYMQNEIKQLPSVVPKQPGWIYIEEALPKTIINEHTLDYQEYNCLCDFGDNGFDVRTYKFGNGHFWNGGGNVDKYVTAWQPLPEIPDALKQKPLEGGQDEN